ncbi:MAG: response regulator transcription factor [Chloroflexi bacterium]|nr:response regulator transcription factor [Chloroflexota bacterium]MCL5273259.1 response regulator transcription factor [Chloroflexota bacterium]
MPANNTQQITVILADDHAVVRSGIRGFLEQDECLHIVAEAGNGDQALALTQAHNPDVLVLDIQMPGRNGIEVAKAVRAAGLNMGILILTAYDDEPYILGALQAGANGYVLKTAEPDELVEAVHSVYEGKSVLDPLLTQRLWQQVASRSANHEGAIAEALTSREIEVLRLVARGFTNKAVAAQLGISDRTVQGHLANVFEKLHAQSRTDAVMIGLRLGLVSANDR